MKRILAVLSIAAALFTLSAPVAMADTGTASLTVTNAQALTLVDFSPTVAGYVEKIEVVTEAASTTTVTVATYSAATNAIETFASAVINGTTPQKVFRPRVLGTDIGGTNLTSTIDLTGGNATGLVTRVFNIPLERLFAGGNLKAAITGTANDGSCPVTVTVYYRRTND